MSVTLCFTHTHAHSPLPPGCCSKNHRPRPDVLNSVAVGWAALAMPQELRAAAECNKREPAVVLPGLRSIVMKPTGSSGPAARRPKTSCDHEAQHEASYWPPTGLCRSARMQLALCCKSIDLPSTDALIVLLPLRSQTSMRPRRRRSRRSSRRTTAACSSPTRAAASRRSSVDQVPARAARSRTVRAAVSSNIRDWAALSTAGRLQPLLLFAVRIRGLCGWWPGSCAARYATRSYRFVRRSVP